MEKSRFIQVTPHIYRFTVPFIGGGVLIWLIREGDEWTVVDAGLPNTAHLIIPAVEKTAGGPPSRIILTHGHGDHVGALKELVQHWNVPVWAHEAEFPYITGPARYRDIRPAVWQYRLLSTMMNARPTGIRIDRMLQDGEQIGALQVIHAPGHAPGLITLLHAQDRAIITGDAVTNLRGKLRQPVAIFTYDPAEARRSMRKLATHDFDHMLISHGGPIFGTARKQLQEAVEKFTD